MSLDRHCFGLCSLHEIDFKTTEVSTEFNTDILDETEESFLTTSYPENLPPKPIVPRYKNVPVETHCDASTLIFMSHVNEIFNDMILNKGEKFNCENIEEYTNFLKETMRYFGDHSLPHHIKEAASKTHCATV